MLTHRMLELLPQLGEDARLKAAARIIDAGINHLSRSEAEAVLAEVLGLLGLPELSRFSARCPCRSACFRSGGHHPCQWRDRQAGGRGKLHHHR